MDLIVEVKMRVTKRQLRRIIKEEKATLLREFDDPYMGKFEGADVQLEKALFKVQQMFVEVNGLSWEDAATEVAEEVDRILGVQQW
jgi:hypothetical protein